MYDDIRNVKITGDQIEAQLLKRLGIRTYVDEYKIKRILESGRKDRKRDKAEWDALDDNCKSFVLDYLAGKEGAHQ